MGVIAKQSIKSSFFIYLGILVGFINTIFLAPQILSSEEIGFLSYVNSVNSIFLAFFSFGMPQLIARIYPRYREQEFKDQKGFFSFVFNVTLIGVLLGIFLFFLIGFSFEQNENNVLYKWLFSILFPLLLTFRMIFRHTDPLVRMMFKSVLGPFLDSFLVKLVILILLLSFWLFDYQDFKIYSFLYTLAFCIPGLVQIFYIMAKKHFALHPHPAINFLKKHKKEALSLMAFGTIGSAGSVFVFEIDKIMIGNLLDLSYTGIYSIAFFFSIFIAVPGKSIRRIAFILLAEAWKNNDLKTIQSIYIKTSLNLFLAGTYLFLGVWLNVDEVLSFLPPEFEKGKYVIFFLGIAQLVDLLTGSNIEIISTSKYYRFSTYFILVMIVLVIITNYIFIPIWGINGAAIASLISISVTNIARMIVLYLKFKIQPFSNKFFVILISGITCYFLISLIPVNFNMWLNIFIKGTILSVVYFSTMVIGKVSQDLNNLINKYLKTNF